MAPPKSSGSAILKNFPFISDVPYFLAKLVQIERRTKQIHLFFIPRCSLTYEKLVQTEDNTK